MRKKRRYPWRWLIGIIVVIAVTIFAVSSYFLSVAMVPGYKDSINNSTKILRNDPLYEQKMWLKYAKKEKWTTKSASGNHKPVADYIPAAKPTTKNVVVAYGFTGNREKMGEYAALSHQMGCNVLMPDACAHGQNQGKYIGYGQSGRYDIRKWINKFIRHNGEDSQVVLFGVDIGGATTMMTSGINPPSQIKAFVEDCRCTSFNDELNYEAGNLYGTPRLLRVPLINAMSLINWVKDGSYIYEASSLNMPYHNHRPMLFIHEAKDNPVPTEMAYRNYCATEGNKESRVVPGVAYMKSYVTHPSEYWCHLTKLLGHYVK